MGTYMETGETGESFLGLSVSLQLRYVTLEITVTAKNSRKHFRFGCPRQHKQNES